MISAIARVAGPKDASLLAELGALTFRNSSPHTPHEDVGNYVRENFTRNKLLASLSTEQSAALILENNKQAIGYAFLSPTQEPNPLVPLRSIQIRQFDILEEWTGCKLGDVLMSRCCEHATALGVESIWLTVWKNNERGIHFYERWGFRNVGTCDFIVGNDIQEGFVLLKNIPLAGFRHT